MTWLQEAISGRVSDYFVLCKLDSASTYRETEPESRPLWGRAIRGQDINGTMERRLCL